MKSSGPYYEDRKICEACKVVIYNTIEDRGGYIIGELLSKHGDGASKDLTELGPDDVEKMARENMRAHTKNALFRYSRAKLIPANIGFIFSKNISWICLAL
ncbi:MAG: hypothetical protein ACW97P_11820 [Candidatus Hodarchaeales archaeon]|jgi:hypothetical protein